MTRQEQITKAVIDSLVASGNPLSLTIAGMPIDEVMSELFHGYRSGSGWQLTDKGFMVMSAAFKPFRVAMEPPRPIVPRVLLLLDQKATFPYHLAIRNELMENLNTFDHDFGFLLAMHGGDIQQALDA